MQAFAQRLAPPPLPAAPRAPAQAAGPRHRGRSLGQTPQRRPTSPQRAGKAAGDEARREVSRVAERGLCSRWRGRMCNALVGPTLRRASIEVRGALMRRRDGARAAREVSGTLARPLESKRATSEACGAVAQTPRGVRAAREASGKLTWSQATTEQELCFLHAGEVRCDPKQRNDTEELGQRPAPGRQRVSKDAAPSCACRASPPQALLTSSSPPEAALDSADGQRENRFLCCSMRVESNFRGGRLPQMQSPFNVGARERRRCGARAMLGRSLRTR